MPAIALLILWAVHDGGYDQDTWYWGALVLLAILGVSWLALRHRRLAGRARAAILLFALYVAWSYLSIAWASSPGDALNGSNRALLYLIVFTLFAVLPWTPTAGLWALVVYALGISAIAVDLMYRLGASDGVASLVVEGRLAAPTGYFNSSVALFMTGALVATALAVRRELPGLIRGLLIAGAGNCLQLALIGQSRGWLFTLPFVLVAAVAVLRNRFRFTLAALIPTLATVIPIHRLLAVYQGGNTSTLNHAAASAGQIGLASFGAALVLGTLVAWADGVRPPPRVSPAARRRLGASLVVLAVGAAIAGGFAATHGRPIEFVKRQWQGFSHEATGGSSSYFATVGSGRYDFWRVALDAFTSHPVGGLGQDNFADYYITRRRTGEEPAWTHSLEMRLLASTGIVGFLLFAGFLVVALLSVRTVLRRSPTPRTAASRPDRPRPGRAPPPPLVVGAPDTLWQAVCAAALLPLVDWLLHGSVDWFWEFPALSGPALGFLGMAVALSRATSSAHLRRPSFGRLRGAFTNLRRPAWWPHIDAAPFLRGATTLRWPAAAGVYLAAIAVLALPYLAVREVSTASNIRSAQPDRALSDLRQAASLDPLWSLPARLGGTIALQSGFLDEAASLFHQATQREPGSWYAWFGAGLAEASLGDRTRAVRDLRKAIRIQTRQPVIGLALRRAQTPEPLNPTTALQMLVPAP